MVMEMCIRDRKKTEVAYDGYVGWQSPWKRPYMLNAADYITSVSYTHLF